MASPVEQGLPMEPNDEAFTSCLAYWQNFFGSLSVDEDHTEVRHQAEIELSQLWRYTGQSCFIEGYCQLINTDASTGDTKTEKRSIDPTIADNQGFIVEKFGKPGSEYWAPAGLFERFVETPNNGEARHIAMYLHLGAPHDIFPLGDLESAFPEGLEFPKLPEVLMRESAKFAPQIQDENFFASSVTVQRNIIDADLKRVEDQCAKIDGGMRDVAVNIEAEHGYAIVESDGAEVYKRINFNEFFVQGTSKGLDVLARRQIMSGKPVTAIEQLIDVDAGFCLVVRLDEAAAELLRLEPDTEVYVPISGQAFKLEFGAPIHSTT